MAVKTEPAKLHENKYETWSWIKWVQLMQITSKNRLFFTFNKTWLSSLFKECMHIETGAPAFHFLMVLTERLQW